jgi:protein gp37
VLIPDGLSWVVIGGESTAKHEDSREFDLAWAESLINECQTAKVPVFFKQTGVAPRYTMDGKIYRGRFQERVNTRMIGRNI